MISTVAESVVLGIEHVAPLLALGAGGIVALGLFNRRSAD